MSRTRPRWIALATVALATLAFAAPASAATETETFNYTGAAQTWTVPPGVTEATFDLYGAQGFGLASGMFAAGRGGRATATIALTPGRLDRGERRRASQSQQPEASTAAAPATLEVTASSRGWPTEPRSRQSCRSSSRTRSATRRSKSSR
jgi:hypothetical protein